VDPRGRPAITHYRVFEDLGEATLLEIRLETGRTHQIRVHLAAIEHPLVGDRAYGSRREGPGRVWLHASGIGFEHPFTHEAVEVVSPLPPDLATDLEVRRRAPSQDR
jgi:23S rRNA pseudouridine1911/1915/1917 synthase